MRHCVSVICIRRRAAQECGGVIAVLDNRKHTDAISTSLPLENIGENISIVVFEARCRK